MYDFTGEFNYSIVWDNYAKIFGRESLRIVSFSNLIDHNVDLFDHFCRAILGLKEAPQVEKGLIQKNAGPNMIDTEILRDLNYLYYIDTSRIDHYTRVKFDRLKNKYDLSALTGIYNRTCEKLSSRTMRCRSVRRGSE